MRQILVSAFAALPRGETQTSIADALGERVQTVNKWAKGYNAPGPNVDLRKLERLLHLDEGALGYTAGATPQNPTVDTELLLAEIQRQGDVIATLEDRLRSLSDRVLNLEDRLGPPPAATPKRSRGAAPTARQGKARP